MSRVDDTHESIKTFLDNTAEGYQSETISLTVIAQMLIEINETLAIMCDKLNDNCSCKKSDLGYVDPANDR